MSETDDTDVLLLIPPNFFLVHTSSSEDSLLESSRTVVHKPSCTAQVIGKLVDQVHSLESRLSHLEVSTVDTSSSFSTLPRYKRSDTTNSLDSLSVDCKYFTFPRQRRRRKVNRKDSRSKRDLLHTSIDIPFRKRVPQLKLKEDSDVTSVRNSDFNDNRSMDGDISSIVSTPSKNNDKLLLHEIDEFLTKVEAYESPETKLRDQMNNYSPENVIKAAGDYISQKLEKSDQGEVKLPSGRVVSSSILDKYIYLVKNQSQPQSEKPTPLSSSHKAEDTSSIQSETKELNTLKYDTKSPSIRKLNFSTETKDVQPTSTPKRLPQQSTSNLDSFRPTSNKIYDRATKVLEQYKSRSYSRTAPNSMTDSSYLTSPKKDEFKMPQMKPYTYDNKECAKYAAMQNKLIDSIDTDLLSLSDLWGEKGEKLERGESLKLEEERLKREHCEAMIQQLQKKILDQQEKLAVALKVDRAKDSAIAKLKEAWFRITSSLDKAEERHRTALEKMVREVENFKMVADEAQKKTNHFEAELYKALDLAHDYQNKCKQLTEDKKHIEEGMEKALSSQRDVITSKDKEIEMLKENYDTVMKMNKQSTDCVKNLEDALNKERSEHDLTKSKVTDLGRKIQSINEDTTLLVQERDILKDKVNEERARVNILERQLCEKQNQTSELLKKCDTLDYEVKTLRKQLELQKNELKVHYQKQLEEAVLSKLHEFQQQLDHAEKELENDARNKEDAIVENFNKQLARIQEQHKLEVNVLEEKQKEEINLYRLQLAQANEKVGLLENKLESYRRRRGQIASQLHSVMEAQWRQALLILTNGHQASSIDLSRPDSDGTGVTLGALSSGAVPQDYAPPKVPPEYGPKAPPEYGPKAPLPLPALERLDRFNLEGLSDNELQHYVKMLLTKPPSAAGAECAPEEPTSDRPERARKRSLNYSKPPWKA